MSALEQWHRELSDGKRTANDFDALWTAACREAADREFAAYVRPQREYVAQLRTKYEPTVRAEAVGSRRRAMWEHDLALAEAEV